MKTLTLEDALRLTGPLSFNLMVKPVGSSCNLGCRYCYYLDKAAIYGGKEPRMSLQSLERYVRTFIQSCEVPEVTFNWHGGEPLLAGLDFYKSAIRFQKKYASGKKISNTIQTNGTLLNGEWARFLRDEDFLVGVSIDGPQRIHDAMRLERNGKPSFAKVISGIENLYRAGARYNLMTAVSRHSEGHGLEIYQFLKTLGTQFIQLLPVAEQLCQSPGETGPRIAHPDAEDAFPAPWNISGPAYGQFLCDIFDYWFIHDRGRFFVNVFDATLAGWCGARPAACIFDKVCGGNAVMEHNGDIYPCDHFVYPWMRLGNLYTDNLKELMRGDSQTGFGMDKRNRLTTKCRQCRYLPICNGECPKHRFEVIPGEKSRHNALCEGYRMFFRHSEEKMLEMRLIVQGTLR